MQSTLVHSKERALGLLTTNFQPNLGFLFIPAGKNEYRYFDSTNPNDGSRFQFGPFFQEACIVEQQIDITFGIVTRACLGHAIAPSRLFRKLRRAKGEFVAACIATML